MTKDKTEIWKEPFFNQLNVEQKVFYIYLRDNSDENGNFELNPDQDSERIGFTVDADFISSFVEVVNKDKPRISKSGTMLKLSEKETDPVEEFIRKQQAAARTGNALKPKS